MKVKHLSALVGLAGTVLIASPANAAFTGVVIEEFDVGVDHFNAAVRAAWNGGGGAGLTSYRIYATFDASGDFVQAVFGDTGRRAFLSVSGGTIYNNIETHSTAPDAFFNLPTFTGGFGSNPERGWDTYAMLGSENNDQETALATGTAAQTNNFTANWNSDLDVAGIAWFVQGAPAQAEVLAANGNRVLIFQLTVTSGSFVEGNFGVQTADEGDLHDDTGDMLTGLHYFAIPSPGAFALLGLAGLTGIRRRRRH